MLATSALSASARDPLVYQRLRFDTDPLQLLRRYQQYYKVDENKKIQVVNASSGERYEYYENDKVDSASLQQDDLIFEALDRTYKWRLVPAYLYNYDKKEDISRASDNKLVSPTKCTRELNFLLEQAATMSRARQDPRAKLTVSSRNMTPEMLALLDSFGHEEPGILFGNYHWVGNWRQCKKRRIFSLDRANASNTLEFTGRYCVASLRSKRWDSIAKQRIGEARLRKHFKYDGQPRDYARFFRIQIGICLPQSCETSIVDGRREDIRQLAVSKLAQPLRSYELADLYCLPDETSDLRKLEPSGWAFIYSLIAWLALTLVCSLYDKGEKPTSFLGKLTNSMSIYRSYERLMETASCQLPPSLALEESKDKELETSDAKTSGQEPNARAKLHPNDLLFINSIKVAVMPLIMFGHVGMMFKQLDRYALDPSLDNDLLFHYNSNTVFLVDWFFVISGFLTTYLIFLGKVVERNTLVQWIYTIFHRYWRLAPLYILLFWFSKSVFAYTSYGPMWDYGTSSMTLRGICRRESWFWPLTLTSNLHPLHEECIMPSWYISCDMQFFMITPVIWILLNKSPRLGWLSTIGAIVAVIAIRLHRYATDDRVRLLELLRPRFDLYMRNNWDIHPTYLFPQYRIAPYLIGILAGHYTYMVLSGKWSSSMYTGQSAKRAGRPNAGQAGQGFSKFIRFLVWFLGILMVVTMMFCTWLMTNLLPVSWEKDVKYFAAFSYATDHSAAGLGLSLVLTTFMLGQCSRLRRFMSHPYWTVLSRVNFVVYLTQVEWIYWLVQSSDHQLELSTLDLLKMLLYVSLIVYTTSFVLALLFEIPLAQLERNFIAKLFVGSAKSEAATAVGGAQPSRGAGAQSATKSSLRSDK